MKKEKYSQFDRELIIRLEFVIREFCYLLLNNDHFLFFFFYFSCAIFNNLNFLFRFRNEWRVWLLWRNVERNLFPHLVHWINPSALLVIWHSFNCYVIGLVYVLYFMDCIVLCVVNSNRFAQFTLVEWINFEIETIWTSNRSYSKDSTLCYLLTIQWNFSLSGSQIFETNSISSFYFFCLLVKRSSTYANSINNLDDDNFQITCILNTECLLFYYNHYLRKIVCCALQ